MKILIEFDTGFLARIERERVVIERADGKRPPRTAMVRSLLRQALDARCAERNEEIPSAEPVAGDA